MMILVILLIICAAQKRDGDNFGLEQKRILILGATGSRGSAFTEHMLYSAKNANVTIVSRGTYYWDTQKFKDKAAEVVECDLNINTLAECKLMKSMKYDACVDFFSKQQEDIEKLSKLPCKFYVLVSNDWVYTVTGKSRANEIRETDGERPSRKVSPEQRYKMKKTYTEGDHMVEAEEALMNQYKSGGFPYTILRTTNLVGTRENRNRYWPIHLMLKAHKEKDFLMIIPDQERFDRTFSITLTTDLASMITLVIRKAFNTICCAEEVYMEKFNVASRERLQRLDLYQYMARPINKIVHNQLGGSFDTHIPMTPCSPMSIEKALKIGYKPADLEMSIMKIGVWYEKVGMSDKYAKEKEDFFTRFIWHDLGNWARKHYHDMPISKRLYFEDEDEDEAEEVARMYRRNRVEL